MAGKVVVAHQRTCRQSLCKQGTVRCDREESKIRRNEGERRKWALDRPVPCPKFCIHRNAGGSDTNGELELIDMLKDPKGRGRGSRTPRWFEAARSSWARSQHSLYHTSWTSWASGMRAGFRTAGTARRRSRRAHFVTASVGPGHRPRAATMVTPHTRRNRISYLFAAAIAVGACFGLDR